MTAKIEPKELWDLLCSVQVAGPWEDSDSECQRVPAVKVRHCRQYTDQLSEFMLGRGRVARVSGPNSDGSWTGMFDCHGANYRSQEEAMRETDKRLRAAGWVLVEEPCIPSD